MDNQEPNFFDDLGYVDPTEIEKLQKESEARADKVNYLVHKTFAQNEAGVELLEIWKEVLIMGSTAAPGMDSVEIGIREGRKEFIREIIKIINRVEKG